MSEPLTLDALLNQLLEIRREFPFSGSEPVMTAVPGGSRTAIVEAIKRPGRVTLIRKRYREGYKGTIKEPV